MRRAALIGLILVSCGRGDDATLVVPSDGLPPEVVPQEANNNLDVVSHDGRIYFAFRSAPTHFASPYAEMYVVSSTDQKNWQFETKIALGTDVREPRFLSWNGKLFLYFAVLGTNWFAFEPKEMRVTERLASGSWTASEVFYMPKFIPWRTKVENGKPYMITYFGGENIYEINGVPLEVHWLTTTDGRNWTAVVPGQPIVLKGGGSETDFVLMDDGALVAIVRNEAGDATGWGSKVCRAEAASLGTWTCSYDPKKYDSPLLFREAGGVWLIGRRNVTETGKFDLGLRTLTPQEQAQTYLIDYSGHTKRCALWKVDPHALTVTYVKDVPGWGDTCFAGMVRVDGQIEVYNYSSPLDGEDFVWIKGQTNPTNIYRFRLELPSE